MVFRLISTTGQYAPNRSGEIGRSPHLLRAGHVSDSAIVAVHVLVSGPTAVSRPTAARVTPTRYSAVRAREVRFCDLEVQHRLASRLVLGLDNLPSLIFGDCSQAGALACFVIDAVEGPAAVATTNQPVACFHVSFDATVTINWSDPAVSASTGRVNARYAEFSRSRKTGVRCGPHGPKLVAALAVRDGGGCRNRTDG